MIIADCPACLSGNHEGHVEHWGKRPPGVIDGEFCYCKGDCANRPNPFDWAIDKALAKCTVTDLSPEAQIEMLTARAESAEAAHEALRAGIWSLGESLYGDEGWEHNEGCEGEPECIACIGLTLRALLADKGTR